MQLKSSDYIPISRSEEEDQLIEVTAQRRSTQFRRRVLILVLLSITGLCAFAIPAVYQTRLGNDSSLVDAPACPQYSPIVAQSEARANLERELTAELNSDEFLKASVKRLQGAVQVSTESFDDMKPVGQDPRWDVFVDFHNYLDKTFPLVFSKLEITKVNTHGLLITWKGTDESLKPYLFMAHQDVVPVPETTVDRWTYPPYEGHYDGRFVWGRGSSDCKNNLIGVLESFETLLQRDHQPKRTILAGFGFDEEISGFNGAQNIGKHLEEQRGRNSLDLILDEGGLGIKDGFARPAIGEKGYFDVKIEVNTEGGHSSVPEDHTGIGFLAQIISAIEDEPYSPELTSVNPYFTTLQCYAEYDISMETWLRKQLKKALNSKSAAKRVADYLADRDITERYLLQTSQAVDLISGGVKINALPEKVHAIMNHRVAVELTVDDVRSHLASVIETQILSKHDLSLDAWGSVSGNTSTTATGHIFLTDFDVPLPPSPVSPLTTDSYKLFSRTIKQVLGKEIVVAPTLMTGNTDTRWYWNLTENIYRFSPVREGGRFNAHTVDERMGMAEHIEGVRFYIQIILNGDEA